MRYAIRGVPMGAHNMLIADIKAQGCKVKARGRGPRYHGGVYYERDLPLKYATHCTLYVECSADDRRSYDIAQFDYRCFDPLYAKWRVRYKGN